MNAPRRTMARALAEFAASADVADASRDAREALKVRVLDALGCALGALGAEPVERVRRYVEDMGGTPPGRDGEARGAGALVNARADPRCSLVGGGAATPPLAAFYNGFLVRYLDYNDSYLATGETCHPSDNLGAVLAAAQDARADGATLLAALAVAYQVQCRLSDEAPVRRRGFDHTVQGSYAAAAGVARALGLDTERATHGIAIAGTAHNALRVTRTGTLSHWKGLAAPNAASGAVHAAYLARRGVTGPPEVFEGHKGFMDAIAGRFQLDWAREDLERVRRTVVKRYDAEVHSQSALEAIEELRRARGIAADTVERIVIEVFDVAYHIIGGGEEGAKTSVATKEQADHSLPYMAAVMLLDGEVTPRQYAPERLESGDVQALLRRVHVEPREDLSRRFPAEMPCAVTITLRDGGRYAREKRDYKGFHTRPADWDDAVGKLHELGARVPAEQREAIVACVRELEERSAGELAELLARVRRER